MGSLFLGECSSLKAFVAVENIRSGPKVIDLTGLRDHVEMPLIEDSRLFMN
jgi:hypothetical protein